MRCTSSSSTTSSRLTLRSAKSVIRSKASTSCSRVTGLRRWVNAPSLRGWMFAVFDGDDVDRNVARLRIVLQPIEHRPSVAIGQPNVERDRVGFVASSQPQRGVALSGDQTFETFFAREVEQDLRESASSSTISTTRSPGADLVAIIGDLDDLAIIVRSEQSILPCRDGRPPPRFRSAAGYPVCLGRSPAPIAM